MYKRGGVRWNVRSAFVECVLSRSSNASGMKKKKMSYISGVSSRQMSRGHVSNVT